MENTIEIKNVSKNYPEFKLDKISSEASEERENLNQNLLELKEENAKCQEENEKLRKENEKLEAKLAKSAEILNKIYRSISKNRD